MRNLTKAILLKILIICCMVTSGVFLGSYSYAGIDYSQIWPFNDLDNETWEKTLVFQLNLKIRDEVIIMPIKSMVDAVSMQDRIYYFYGDYTDPETGKNVKVYGEDSEIGDKVMRIVTDEGEYQVLIWGNYTGYHYPVYDAEITEFSGVEPAGYMLMGNANYYLTVPADLKQPLE